MKTLETTDVQCARCGGPIGLRQLANAWLAQCEGCSLMAMALTQSEALHIIAEPRMRPSALAFTEIVMGFHAQQAAQGGAEMRFLTSAPGPRERLTRLIEGLRGLRRWDARIGGTVVGWGSVEQLIQEAEG